MLRFITQQNARSLMTWTSLAIHSNVKSQMLPLHMASLMTNLIVKFQMFLLPKHQNLAWMCEMRRPSVAQALAFEIVKLDCYCECSRTPFDFGIGART
mmetsp:Transcript_91073/g.161338  ORF Transcript_91073/g.161338 Transcript_91073/m.161338 type:complete len:98 (+) Transcript_91073:1222-1515(+)